MEQNQKMCASKAVLPLAFVSMSEMHVCTVDTVDGGEFVYCFDEVR